MNRPAHNQETRWAILGLLCIFVYLGVLLGSTLFSIWGKRTSPVLAAPLETRESPFPEIGSSKTILQARNSFSRPSGINSIASSTITTKDCYQSGDTWTMCFTVHNASADGEWLDQVRLTFPELLGAWGVACFIQDANDSNGSPVGMNCSINAGKEVVYTDNDLETPSIGEISAGASWMFCVDVTVPGSYTGPRIVNWGLSGDEEVGSDPPHDITGQITCRPMHAPDADPRWPTG